MYVLHNPSDAVTFEANSVMIAALVAGLLGDGWYPATDVDTGTDEVPLINGGFWDWFEERWGNANDVIPKHRDELVVALRSVACASPEARRALLANPWVWVICFSRTGGAP